MGGMHEIVKAMVKVAEEQGVTIICDQEVKQISVEGKNAKRVVTQHGTFEADAVVAGSDYEHTEKLLQPEYRNYSAEYWEKRTMSPSSLLYYIGLNKRVPGAKHHSLFFDEDFELHAQEIYKNPKWPSKPLFYACCPSATDPTVAPEGCENIFFLMPLAPGLQDSEAQREQYFQIMLKRYERLLGCKIEDAIVVKRSYAMQDFEKDYHSFKGNAYGLANTLLQTAFLKPKLKSKKVQNLFFTGQLTVPGPGVPPSLISGQIVAKEVDTLLRK
jgi:phytoene desaturase